MPNVFQIKDAAERRAAERKKKEENESKDDEPDGLLQFTRNAQGDDLMSVKGVYAERLQCAVYALVKGLSDLTDRLVESGTVGRHNSGPIQGQLQRAPARRATPRRLRVDTEYGDLK